MDGDKPKRQQLKRYPIGYFLIDIAEVRTNEGRLYIIVTLGRISKFGVKQFVDKPNRRTAWFFKEAVLEAVLYKIHTILTDSGFQFCEWQRNCKTPYFLPMWFDMVYFTNGTEHRLTQPNHSWTDKQLKRYQC